MVHFQLLGMVCRMVPVVFPGPPNCYHGELSNAFEQLQRFADCEPSRGIAEN